MENWRGRLPAAVVVGLGVSLLVAAGAHHASEIDVIDHVGGPLSAFIVDTLPAVLLVAAGFVLHDADVSVPDKWRVAVWTVAGGGLFAAVTATTILVREFEGRTVAEPEFPLLVTGGMGALAGFVAGYFEARARRDAERAKRMSHAFSVVNDVLRHDVRNNLGIVSGNAERVATATDDESITDHATTIHEQADDALDRIDSADAVAHSITGDAAREPVDLVPYVETAVEHVEDAHDIAVTTDLPETARVRANDAVQSVVDNLVENAAEHNDADDPWVTVAVERAVDEVRFEVRDNGPGVEDALDHVEEGGLDLVQTLVEHFDGDVHATTNEPRGTVVVVTLPRASDN